MDVRFLKKKADLEANDTVDIFNPDISDFSWAYSGESYAIDSKEYKTFPKHIGEHLAKHLADKLSEDGSSWDENYKRII